MADRTRRDFLKLLGIGSAGVMSLAVPGFVSRTAGGVVVPELEPTGRDVVLTPEEYGDPMRDGFWGDWYLISASLDHQMFGASRLLLEFIGRQGPPGNILDTMGPNDEWPWARAVGEEPGHPRLSRWLGPRQG